MQNEKQCKFGPCESFKSGVPISGCHALVICQHRCAARLEAFSHLLRRRHISGEHKSSPATVLIGSSCTQMPSDHRLLHIAIKMTLCLSHPK